MSDRNKGQANEKSESRFFRVGSGVVREGTLKEMTAVDLKVYLVLAEHANWRTGRCWPSYATIRDLTGSSRASIASAVRHLVELGAISCGSEKARNGRRNVYTVFRTLRRSPGSQSRATDDPPSSDKKRDRSGRFQSKSTCTNYRTLQPPPGSQSSGADYPPSDSEHNRSSIIQSSRTDDPRSSGTDDPRSSGTDDPQSSGTDQNEIHLNESNRTRLRDGRSSESSSRPSPLTISEDTLKELIKVKGREGVIEMLKQGNYPIPPSLLAQPTAEDQRGQA